MSKQSNDKMAAKLIMCFVAIAVVCTIVVLVMKMKSGLHTDGTSDSAIASTETQSAGTAAAGSTAASAATGSTAAAVSTEGTTLEASNAAVETPATQFDLSTLDNTEEPFGYSTQNLDENNIPTDWKWYYNQWGQFNAMWIGDTTQKVVYLTMDEGFANDLTSTELDILKEKNVKCTFMLTKDFVDGKPDLVQRMIDEGHLLGDHTCTHPKMPEQSIDDQTNEIMGVYNEVYQNYGYQIKLFRFPYGDFSAQSLGLANNLGFKVVFWTYAYNDYDTNNQPDVATSLQQAVDRVHPGAIYLLHANSTTNCALLGDFIDQIRAKGYEFALIPLDPQYGGSTS